MFKNQLQDLSQRSCYDLPLYKCTKEGPDHAPRFKASVEFNGKVFESPGYFSTRKHAEQAAAEVALKGLQATLDDSGLCKVLLLETAQRAGVPPPAYSSRMSGQSHEPMFTCTVEVATMQFVGESARTKKQAEKNAALIAWTALLKKACNRSSATVDAFDVADEKEQEHIADFLRKSLNEKQFVPSTAAALGKPRAPVGGKQPQTRTALEQHCAPGQPCTLTVGTMVAGNHAQVRDDEASAPNAQLIEETRRLLLSPF